MIPKIMHFYWCGNDMCWMRYISIYSFVKMNPTWKVVLHYSGLTNSDANYTTPQTCDFLLNNQNNYLNQLEKIGVEIRNHFIGIGDFDTTLNPVFKSDLSRWQILHKEGGFYSDTDILYMKPVEYYISDDLIGSLDLVSFFDRGHICAISFLGSAKEHPYFKDIEASAIKNYRPSVYESMGALAIHNLLDVHKPSNVHPVKILWVNLLRKKYPGSNIFDAELSKLYPINSRIFEHVVAKPMDDNLAAMVQDCLGLHWFGGHPSTDFLRLSYSQDTYKNYNNIITYCLRHIFGE